MVEIYEDIFNDATDDILDDLYDIDEVSEISYDED